MKQQLFALIDCDNFFVSCVRVFRPDLEGRPVVALSSNDGCAVSRSNEAKALGIPMGVPVFKWREFFKQHGVICFSGNFELYGDMSRRIISILTTITPHIEVYSVDESFLDLSGLTISNYEGWGREVRKRILQWTGIPVSIGIAPTKTLAKLATEHAKKHPDTNGVVNLKGSTLQNQAILQATVIKDVWGVGWRLTPKLHAEGISTALDIANMQPRYAQSLMGIRGRQLVAELNGVSCFPLQKQHKQPRSIANTRTFGEDTDRIDVLEAATTSFVAKASRQLRESHQLTTKVGVFIATNKHRPGYTMTARIIELNYPTADNGVLNQVVSATLRSIFRSGHLYHRAGVWLQDFLPDYAFQPDLLGEITSINQDKSTDRMQAIDILNQRYGKRTVHYASEDLASSWQPKRGLQIPRWTTRWDELPRAIIL